MADAPEAAVSRTLCPHPGGARTLARILDAAATLMSSVGITRATTREIARAAGCSEVALYKHFQDQEGIFARAPRERAPRLSDALASLPQRAGSGELAAALTDVATVAVAFYRRGIPMAAGLLADQELLAAHRRKMARHDTGPQEAVQHLAAYLRLEQRHWRVDAGVNPDAAAGLLIGACFHRAFLELFFADSAPEGAVQLGRTEEFVSEIVRTLLDGLTADDSAESGVT